MKTTKNHADAQVVVASFLLALNFLLWVVLQTRRVLKS